MASYSKVKFVGSFMSILSTSTIVLIWTFMPQISKNYIQIKFGNQYYIHFLRKEIFLLGCYNLSCISLFCGGLFKKRKIFIPWFVIQMFLFGNLICWIQLFVPGFQARIRVFSEDGICEDISKPPPMQMGPPVVGNPPAPPTVSEGPNYYSPQTFEANLNPSLFFYLLP